MTRIIAIGEVDGVLRMVDSERGEIHTLDQLPAAVAVGAGGVVVGSHLYTQVSVLNTVYGQFDNWVSQTRAHRRTVVRNGKKRMSVGHFLPTYFGFTNRYRNQETGKMTGHAKGAGRLFHCMDLAQLADRRSVTLQEAFEYAQSILELCEARGVKFSATRGGLAAKLVKASPHWELGRHAAPEFVNKLARENLPGNYYGLGVPKGIRHKQAIYVDQVSAHHAVAASVPLPHPMHLRARGYHRQLEQGVRRPWLRPGPELDHLFTQHGLIACIVNVQHIRDDKLHLYPPFMQTPGRKLVYLYTNERHYFGPKAILEYAVAAWTSPIADPALSEYAEWSLAQRNAGVGRKGLLLAAYGMLAQRTDQPSISYYPLRRLSRGVATFLPGAGRMAEVTHTRREGQPQPSIVNVLARGMIEAETRARSLLLAQELDARGVAVLSVYVDGLIVDTDRLPILPPGWQIEAELTNVTFQHPSSFTSDQLSKQPGIPQGFDPNRGAAARMMKARRGTKKPLDAGVSGRGSGSVRAA